jgi:MFS family permease
MRNLNPVETYSSPRSLFWVAVCALASVYGSSTLAWMVYRVHLPAQMTQLGFSAQAAPLLLLVEALLAIAVEPIAGVFSDRLNRQQGSRLPLIAVSVGLAALILVAIPALASGANIGREWIVGLLLVWAIVMSCFRSPALALLRRYAPMERLPHAASLLTVAFGLAGSATPLASKFVLGLGSTLSFTLAATVTVVSAMGLQWANPVVSVDRDELRWVSQSISLMRCARIFGLGLCSTLAFRLTIETFPKLLKAQIPRANPPLFVGLLFISLAIAALPVGKFAVRQGNQRTMILGVGMTVLFLGLMLLSLNLAMAMVIAVGLGIGFSFIINGTFPFVSAQVASERTGMGMGIFFAGVAVATSLMLGFLGKPGMVLPSVAIGLDVGALAGVGVCVTSRVGKSSSIRAW